MPNSELPVSRLIVDAGKCIACGRCVRDCVAGVLSLVDGAIAATPESDARCIGCQHCLAICPVAAIGVTGKEPSGSEPLRPYDPEALELLIKGRRSVRSFAPGAVDPETLRRIIEVAAHAPAGVNARNRRFTVVYKREDMDALRDRTVRLLLERGEAELPEDHQWLVDSARRWEEKRHDVVFRTAPHLLVVTAGPNQICPREDCLIALSHFDLYAQTMGVGTVWCGMMYFILEFFPETRAWLNIPEDHTVGYAMLFGPNGIKYARTAQHEAEEVCILDGLGK